MILSAALGTWLSLISPADFPDSQFLQGFRESTEFVYKATPLEGIRKVPLQCDSKELWPTHPQETSKDYHFAVWAPYDHGKLPPRSYACQRANPTGRFCVLATYAVAAVLSDYYIDECGNSYRGYWLVTFLKSDENMGTLLSRGRTVYPRPGAEYEGDFVTGDTYPVESSEFLFLSPVSEQELRAIKTNQRDALKEGYRIDHLHWKK